MGSKRELTRAEIVKLLNQASERYGNHRKAGDDMAKAGEELSATVRRIVVPAPCGIPRNRVLEEKQRRARLEEFFNVHGGDIATAAEFGSEGVADEGMRAFEEGMRALDDLP